MDAIEQRLIADLADAAEAAVDRGLTPPDRAAVAATVARRHQRRRVQVIAAVAAVVIALAGLAAALTGGASTDRTEMQPPAGSDPTAPPATAGPGTTPSTTVETTPTAPPGTGATDTTEAGTSPDTTPNDPEQPGPGLANPLPVVADEVLAIGATFADLPPTCRAYWDATGLTPEDNDLDSTQNLLEIEAAGVTIADVNGDGVDDGVATYTCATGGTMPPDGIVVMLAVEGAVESERQVLFDRNELSAEHTAQFGDGRTRFSGPPTVITTAEGERLIEVPLASYRRSDPTCCPSATAIAQFGMAGDAIQLVNLNQA